MEDRKNLDKLIVRLNKSVSKRFVKYWKNFIKIAPENPVLWTGFFTCARHDALAGEARVRRYRTEGQRQQGKGTPRNGVSGGSMRQNPCT